MTKVNKSLTGEAIVAGENNSEIINEQVETAQVCNQENNSDCIEETNCQDSVEPEVATCDTAFVNANDTSTENTLGASSIKDRDAYDYACLGSLYDGSFFEEDFFKDKR